MHTENLKAPCVYVYILVLLSIENDVFPIAVVVNTEW